MPGRLAELDAKRKEMSLMTFFQAHYSSNSKKRRANGNNFPLKKEIGNLFRTFQLTHWKCHW